ncbi:MAG: bacterial Ig-like domain-containing protein, partial [Clostridia bacterium]|nr:bacterial Ig-like domain-containing protein [Clostridia bacterium]
YAGEKSVGATFKTDKAQQTQVPNAPTVQSKTDNSITLVSVSGCEYSKDGINWQSSNVFNGLECGTQYVFYQRYFETSTHYVGNKSAAVSVKTEKGTQAQTVAPTLLRKTYDMVTLVAVNGCEYSNDGINWQASNVFTGLNPETIYSFYQRKTETDRYNAGSASEALIVQTEQKPIILVSIEITAKPNKLSYCEGEEFDPTGMIVTAYYDNNTNLEIANYTIEGYSSTVGLKTIVITYEGKTATFEVEVKAKKQGWELNGSSWLYYEDGIKATGWKLINYNWYYFNTDGIMQTGWLLLGNTWYFLADGGNMLTGWQLVGNFWYYFADGGNMVTGWLNLGGTWYYFADGGNMVTGWLNLGGTWYYFADGGNMVTGWQYIGSSWYYFHAGGNMATGWVLDGNTWYYMADSGVMLTGWQYLGGVWYLFADSGAWIG